VIRFTPKRYQLKKEAATAVKQGHPWIYRSKVSTAASVFAVGQWLQLVGPQNDVLGYGIYEEDGIIAIRVLKQGSTKPDAAWIGARVDKAIAKREHVRKYSDAFRAIHGENDGLPGIVVDVYKDTAVLQTYVPSVDTLGRFVAAVVGQRLGLKNIVWKLPVKRKSQREDRVLRGHLPAEVKVREGKLTLTTPVGAGQKSGAFLDLRGLRKWVAGQKLDGRRVLNLFSYTGTLGLAAEVAGAREIWNVDISKGALEVAKRLHALSEKKHRWIAADIFEWLGKLDPDEKFDLIIVDPPMMASQKTQVDTALRAYRKLYRESQKHLTAKGTIVGACCTSRIPRSTFEQTVAQSLGGMKKVASLPPEDDHPVSFPEGDYLKIVVYRA
jgi:23S rRNA (cytosine1962-C5)-methyltransferase